MPEDRQGDQGIDPRQQRDDVPSFEGASNNLQDPNNPENIASNLSPKEIRKRNAMQLMRNLTEINDPRSPFITTFWEGADQQIIVNKPVDIGTAHTRILITSEGVFALDKNVSETPRRENYTNDYIRIVYDAKKRGSSVQTHMAVDEYGKAQSLDITIASGQESFSPHSTFRVNVIQSQLRDQETILKTIADGHREAKESRRDTENAQLFKNLSEKVSEIKPNSNLQIPPTNASQ